MICIGPGRGDGDLAHFAQVIDRRHGHIARGRRIGRNRDGIDSPGASVKVNSEGWPGNRQKVRLRFNRYVLPEPFSVPLKLMSNPRGRFVESTKSGSGLKESGAKKPGSPPRHIDPAWGNNEIS